MTAKGFITSDKIQSQVSGDVKGLLGSWQGNNTRKTLASIESKFEDVRLANQDSEFAWYVRRLEPLLSAQAQAEENQPFSLDPAVRPMTALVDYLCRQSGIFSIDDIDNVKVSFATDMSEWFGK